MQHHSTPSKVAVISSTGPRHVKVDAEMLRHWERGSQGQRGIDRGSWHLLSLATPSLSAQAALLLL